MTAHLIQSLQGRGERTLEDLEKIRVSLRRLMWGKVGLVRTGDSLVNALGQISRWEALFEHSPLRRGDLEVKNMIQVGRCIAEAALWRENSLGAHFRADFPNHQGREWKTHSLIQRPLLQNPSVEDSSQAI